MILINPSPEKQTKKQTADLICKRPFISRHAHGLKNSVTLALSHFRLLNTLSGQTLSLSLALSKITAVFKKKN